MGSKDLLSWIDVGEGVNLMGLTVTGDWMRGSNRYSFLFEDIGAQVFFWILVVLIFSMTIRTLLLNFSSKYRQMNASRQVNVLIYFMEILFSTYCVIFIGIYVGYMIFQENMQRDVLNSIDDMGTTPQWLEVFKRFSVAIGYGILPVLTLYACELVFVSITKPKIEIFSHHFVTIVLTLFVYRAAQQCVDLKFVKLGWFCFFDLITEQPMFIGLLMHRFNFPSLKNRFYVWIFIVVYSIIQRATITGLIIYSYWDISWNSVWVTGWAYFFRIMFPFLLFVLVVVQVYCIYIYLMLALRSRRSPRTHEEELKASNTAHERPVDPEREQKKKIKKNIEIVSIIILLMLTCSAIIVILSSPHPFSCSPTHVFPKRIAIVGSGIAGLSAAFSFTQQNIHNVTIYEINSYVGGHALSFTNPSNNITLDLGVQGFNANFYNFYQLLLAINYTDELEPVSQKSSVTVDDTFVGFSGDLPRGTPQVNVGIERIKFTQVISQLGETMTAKDYSVLTLADVVNAYNFSAEFSQNYLKACLSPYSLTSIKNGGHLNVLVSLYVNIEKIFGVCTNGGTSSTQRFKKGMGPFMDYFKKYLQDRGVTFVLNTNVTRVFEDEQKKVVRVKFSKGQPDEFFDQVIITAGYKQAMELVQPPKGSLLNKVMNLTTYFETTSVVTTSTDAFSSKLLVSGCYYLQNFNYRFNNPNTSTESLTTTILNAPFTDPNTCYSDLVPVSGAYTLLVSSGPINVPTGSILKNVTWEQPNHDRNFILAGKNMYKFQGQGGIWFAGASYTTSLHECAHVSGLVVAAAAGGANYPYQGQGSAQAQELFLALRSWMLYGLNPFTIRLSH